MKVNLLLPSSLSEIPLSRYQEFVEMKENSNDEEFIANKMIQIFCGIKLKEVLHLQMKDINNLIVHFSEVFKEKPQLIRQFKIKDIEFGFIPKLDDITLGEYVDLESHLKDWKTYHKAMAVMYRPIKDTYKDKYSIVDYEPNEDMQDLMKFAPLDVAISASVFFWNIANELLKASISYLQKEMKKMTNLMNTQSDTNLEDSGDGIQVSMLSLEGMLQDLTKSQGTDLLNVLPISPLKNKKKKSKSMKLTAK
tara:strand:- start:2295 stop:3047 length:753 start_codon:yes stop_codon:yes gene_type:complete